MCSVWSSSRRCGVLFPFWHQLGYEDTENRGGCGDESISDLVTVDLGTDFQIVQIQMMFHHGCALSTNDELKCWGK